MVVGVMEMTFILYETASLKDKRSVTKRLINRITSKFNAAAAEVDDMDAHSHTVIGVTVVGNESKFIAGVLDNIENFAALLGLAELYSCEKSVETY